MMFQTFHTAYRCLFFFLAAALIAGCGGGIQRAAVEGQVSLDGKPIQKGSIFFRPSGETKGMTAGGEIADGRYSLPAEKGPAVGGNLVEIYTDLRTGRKVPLVPGDPKAGMKDEVLQAVAPRYNTQTTLHCEIAPGDNSHNFEVTSK